MNGLLASSIMLAAILIPTFAVMMHLFWGWIGMALYLIFAGLCLMPSVVKYRKMRKEGKL